MRNHLLIIAAVFLATATPLAAQEAPAETVEDIVVTARRIEGPMWEVRRGDSVLILVGAIDGLPRDMEWRTDALVSAVERADRVLFPVEGRASLADLGRVIWRVRTLTRLPDDRTSADYLPPALEARLERVTGQGPSRQSFLMLSSDLMEQGGYARRARPVSEVVRKAARAGEAVRGQAPAGSAPARPHPPKATPASRPAATIPLLFHFVQAWDALSMPDLRLAFSIAMV